MRILYELPPVLRELVHSTALGEIKQPTTTIPMLSFTNTISMLFIPSTLFLIRHLSRILLMHICVLLYSVLNINIDLHKEQLYQQNRNVKTNKENRKKIKTINE